MIAKVPRLPFTYGILKLGNSQAQVIDFLRTGSLDNSTTTTNIDDWLQSTISLRPSWKTVRERKMEYIEILLTFKEVGIISDAQEILIVCALNEKCVYVNT